jgi:predicted transcriptional regulator
MAMYEELRRIRAFIKKRKVTKTYLAERAGIHANSLNRVDKDDWEPRRGTRRKLIEAIDAIESEAKRKA